MIERPLLAATLEADKLEALGYPVLVSPKLDGIRTLIHHEHGPVSRKFKPIPNRWLREIILDDERLHGFDGELVVPNASFNETQSAVMSVEGQPQCDYWVFDDFSHYELSFEDRMLELGRRLAKLPKIPSVRIRQVLHRLAFDAERIEQYAATFAAEGYEGVMVRDPRGPYKQGRSTLKQGILLKLKGFADAEGVIVGFEERMHNANTAERDNLGYTKRSSAKDGKCGMDTLGALIVDTQWGELRIGTGFTDHERKWYWDRRDRLVGEVITFKYQAFGMDEKPRFPVFLHFRED